MSLFLKTAIRVCTEFRLFAKETPCVCISAASKKKVSAVNMHHKYRKSALSTPYRCHGNTSMPERQMVRLGLGQDRLLSRYCQTNETVNLFPIAL